MVILSKVAESLKELMDAMNAVLGDMTEDDFNTVMTEAISVQPEV